MKTTFKALIFGFSISLFLVSCNSGDGSSKNTLYYNNYTGADTEAFEFLKEVAEEADYQLSAAQRIGNPQIADEVLKTYSELAEEIHNLGITEKVLSPTFAKDHAPVNNEIGELIKSQEKIVSLFKRVTENTNVNIADYAKRKLPELENLLATSRSAK